MNPRQKLARVRRLRGPITWYLEDDHLLAADQNLFELTYRRFYYEDVRSVLIWPNRQLWWRIAVEALVGGLLGWLFVALGRVYAGYLLWAATMLGLVIEFILGPRTSARIQTAHSTFTSTFAPRWRDAQPILAQIKARLPRRVEP